MAKCDICGKGPQFGNNVPYSKKRTKRSWSPNIQKVTIMVDGKPKQVNMCTRCMRTRYKSAKK